VVLDTTSDRVSYRHFLCRDTYRRNVRVSRYADGNYTEGNEIDFRNFRDKFLKKIKIHNFYVPKREEEAGDWRRLNNKELHNLCTSRNITKVIK
jgi:hypothetical protein